MKLILIAAKEFVYITLTDDEVALIRSLLTALRGIKICEIDKALVILAKADRGGKL